jgi:hypothetical protein
MSLLAPADHAAFPLPQVRLTYKGLVLWGDQGGCDDEFAHKVLRAKMSLAETEADFAATAQARERAAMAAYHRLSSAPPMRRALAGVQPAPARRGTPERVCFSSRCCGKLLERAEFSKKQ